MKMRWHGLLTDMPPMSALLSTTFLALLWILLILKKLLPMFFLHFGITQNLSTPEAYLGGIARNKAKEYTRKIGTELSLEDDIIIISDENLEHDFEKREQAKYIQEAVLALNAPEREIFLRYYFFYQPIATIATEMNLEPANVKTKLYRGRKRLKEILENGGYTVET